MDGIIKYIERELKSDLDMGFDLGVVLSSKEAQVLVDAYKQLKHKIMILEKPWMEQEFFCKHTVRSDKGIACELTNSWCVHVNNQDRCITFEEEE